MFNNGSDDGTPELLASWEGVHKWLNSFSSPTNLGFPRANNILAENSTGDILLFVNNDVIVDGDFITPIVQQLESNSNQIVGPFLVDWNSGWNSFTDSSGKPIIIEYVGGWCLGITRENFNKLGKFNEDYSPADVEDLELSYLAVQAGMSLKQVIVPLKHLSGQSGQFLDNRHSITVHNRELFAKKYKLTVK